MLSTALSYATTILLAAVLLIIGSEAGVFGWLDWPSVGLTIFALVVFVIFRARVEAWANGSARPGRPQSITHYTRETPSQITWSAIRSFLFLLAAFFVLFALFVFLAGRVLDVRIPI
jgi:hypothetical protein